MSVLEAGSGVLFGRGEIAMVVCDAAKKTMGVCARPRRSAWLHRRRGCAQKQDRIKANFFRGTSTSFFFYQVSCPTLTTC